MTEKLKPSSQRIETDAKEPDPSPLNVRELRGRNVNEELHNLSIRQSPPGPICVQSTVKNIEKNIYLPLPISQRTQALVGTILSQSSSDLDTDQGEIIDEVLKKVAQTFSQTLLMTTTSYPTSNLKLKQKTHIIIPQTVNQPSTLNTSDIQFQTITPPKDAYK